MDDSNNSVYHSGSFETEGKLFCICPLIENIPEDYEYTCIEYHEKHIYLGTKCGVLLHYYELDSGNFMLISELKFDETKQSSIDKITLLPNIERALVLSENKLKMFLLPEFAPFSTIPSILNIVDFSIVEYIKQNRSYICFLYTKNLVKEVNITNKDIKVIKKFEIHSIQKAVVTENSSKLLAAIDNSYAIVDLEAQRTSPLFKISEQKEEQLIPVIARFGKTEFLVTCGIGQEESSMGIIVNENGDITQGTIVFEKYPNSVIVDYPYVFAETNNSKSVYIYMMKENEEPNVLQTVAHGQEEIHVYKSSKIISIRPPFINALVEKLRYVPLMAEVIQFREDQEKAYVERAANIECNTLIFGTCGIFCLCLHPAILNIKSYGEEGIPFIEETIALKHNGSKLMELQDSYFKTLYVLMLTFHRESIDNDLIDIWLRYVESADIRLLIYLCGFKIYGDLWIPNGLLVFVQKLHSLHLIHKCKDITSTVLYLKARLLANYKDVLKDSTNVLLSLDMILLSSDLAKRSVNVNCYEPSSYSEIAKELEVQQDTYSEELLTIYLFQSRITDVISILRDKDPKRLIKYLTEHASELPEDYLEGHIMKDICLSLENYDEETTKCVFKLIEKLKINLKDLIANVENSSAKVLLLERLGAETPQDQKFLCEYYLTCLDASSSKLQDSLDEIITAYRNNLTYQKPKFQDYLMIKLGTNQEFMHYLETGRKLLSFESTFERRIRQGINKIDISFVLQLVLFADAKGQKYLRQDELFEIYLSRNDFMSIETFISDENIETILNVYEHYLSLNDISIIQNFLVRNVVMMQDTSIFIEIVNKLPSTTQLSILLDVIFPMLRRLGKANRNFEIEKALVKNQLQIMKDVERRLEY